MAATNTDKFRKLVRRWVGQIGAGGVATNVVTTVPLSSTTNLPTDTAVAITINRVDSSGTATPTLEETVVGVVSGDNLVNCLRGVEGTAQAHSAGAVAEVLVNADNINDMIDGIVAEHSQLGAHNANIALTTPTLTTPIIASIYQDAGKTKLMTLPNTASDTLAAIAATQTLTNKTINGSQLVDASVVSKKMAPTYKTATLAANFTTTTTGSFVDVVLTCSFSAGEMPVNGFIIAFLTASVSNSADQLTAVGVGVGAGNPVSTVYATAKATSTYTPSSLIALTTVAAGAAIDFKNSVF